METKPKKAAGKDKSSDRKVQTKGKRAAEGKQAEVANQETKDLPAENGETEDEQSPASEEAEEKEAKPDGAHTLRPVGGPCFPPWTSQTNIFINCFVNATFLVALETFFKRRESHLIPSF